MDMDGIEKLRILDDLPNDEVDEGDRRLTVEPATRLDRSQPGSPLGLNRQVSLKDPSRQNIHRAILPGGGSIPLLKTMQTSICEHNCNYCGFRAGRDFRRVTFTPDEMARTFLALQRAGVVEGLFLSSGVINGGAHSQDRILATAELLRKRYHYQGYLHLKLDARGAESPIGTGSQAWRIGYRSIWNHPIRHDWHCWHQKKPFMKN